MTPVLLPVPANVTPHAERLLETIRSTGGWVSRTQIAVTIGKTRLNRWEVGLLDVLTDKGLIEVSKRPVAGPVGQEWIYRARESGETEK